MKCFIERVENIVEVRENTGYLHVLLNTMFSKSSFLRVVKSLDHVAKGRFSRQSLTANYV